MSAQQQSSFEDVFARFRAVGPNAARGEKFEELMVQYFQQDPTLASKYTDVSRWINWPHREGTVDTGIDLVARSIDDGSWTAIQCKFFEPKTYLQKGQIDSFFTASGKSWDGVSFTNRIIISTTDRWSSHAEAALENQIIPVQRIGLSEIAASQVDWLQTGGDGLSFRITEAEKFEPRPHQSEAIEKILQGFEKNDRGQWISACGTGKTFTSLKLAERIAAERGSDTDLRVLFLAPSIQLVSQTLREWTAQTQLPLRPNVVCSDTKASRVTEDLASHDLVLPATTDPSLLFERLKSGRRASGLNVVFSTYQSIDVVAEAQHLGAPEFDLILCDEAHRTTGVTLAGEDESHFVRVHDNDFIRGARRLYMTATPRMFGDAAKGKAKDHSAELVSMDDAAKFGPVFHRLGFGESVERGLLTDYKVMVLMVDEDQMSAPLQQMIAGSTDPESREIKLDDAAKIIGCWNGLAKRTRLTSTRMAFPPNAVPMKRAVAFLPDIKSSKSVASAFPELVSAANIEADETLTIQAEHVDGSMNALERASKLSWLKAPVEDGDCRILTNARCLSEGVDVPALDAVLFMSPRNSQVDVIQAVGRVMRRSPGKDYGYIILPVAVPAGVEPDEALNSNKRFKVIWDILNALRAHDDRFDAMINSISLNTAGPGEDGAEGGSGSDQLLTGTASGTGEIGADGGDGDTKPKSQQPALFSLHQWRDSIYARIVRKVGTREYWDQWASDVAEMSHAQTKRINQLIDSGRAHEEFEVFLAGLRGNLNDSITRDDAVSMLSQHLITAPVFDALFGQSSFARQNPVSQSMEQMLQKLEGQGLEAETENLERFYESVRVRASEVSSAAGRQQVVHDLYEKFFKNAFPRQASAFGVVYTPVEIVDFMLRAADDVCRAEFGYGLTDEGVHVLDPFTGTGTFIVRLLQSGIIKPHDLARKYAGELWANEIMLLAYYIACVNIESTFQAVVPDSTEYLPFPGASMTDTFQITEDGDRADTSLIPQNNERIEQQLSTDIRVIVGNPPYSVGQTSANDNNQNLKYPTLDRRIAETYAGRSTATNKNSLYDSYIRAYRWATDRLGDDGVVAFVSNGGWLDGNTADGLRLSIADEFSKVYAFNMRGNARTSGDLRQKEKDNVFGQGSRATVVVFIGVKKKSHDGPCQIYYRDIGDYLTREQKLSIVNTAQLTDADWDLIKPNQFGDWLSQRSEAFTTFPAIGESREPEPITYFSSNSRGVETTRDAWVYNFSRERVAENVTRMIDEYNRQVAARPATADDLERDPTKIKWSSSLIPNALKHNQIQVFKRSVTSATYRPFCRNSLHFDPMVNHRTGKMAHYFPTSSHSNLGFYVVSPEAKKPFSALMTTSIVDLALYGSNSGQYFPRFTYRKAPTHAAPSDLFDGLSQGEPDEHGYIREDNITDGIQKEFETTLGSSVTKDDIFFYVYGLLHSPAYRAEFEADLKKMLPRIPVPGNLEQFRAFADAGRQLSDLHVGYEEVEPYPLEEHWKSKPPSADNEPERFRIQNMKVPRINKEPDRSRIVVNSHLTLAGIPEDAHRYMLGSRSALEWIIDRYQVKTDKASQIVNDPNDYSDEIGNPRYIVDLIKRVTTVSIETMRIVDSLPTINFAR